MLDDVAIVYTKTDCPWCHKAIDLLEANGFRVQERLLDRDYTREELLNMLGTKKATVPQIFIDGQLVGGYDHLASYFGMQEAMCKR